MITPPKITVDGIRLAEGVDEAGLSWGLTSWAGLIAGSSVRTKQADRLGRHGQHVEPGYRNNRILNVTGWCAGREAQYVDVARAAERLDTVLADGGWGEYVAVIGGRLTRRATVQLLDAQNDHEGRPNFTFQLQMLATTPYLYGSTSVGTATFASVPPGAGAVFPAFPDGVMDFGALGSDGAVAEVRNDGTAPASPLFSVAGPIPDAGFAIGQHGIGTILTYVGDCPAGSTLTIDPDAGTALLDGVANRTGDLIVDRWPTVAPESESVFTFLPLSAATESTLTVTVRSTYW